MPTRRKRRAGRGEGGPSGPPPVTKARFKLADEDDEIEVGQGPQSAQGDGLAVGLRRPRRSPNPAGEHDAAGPAATLDEMRAEGEALLRRFAHHGLGRPDFVLALDRLEHRREGRPRDVAPGALLDIQLAVGPDQLALADGVARHALSPSCPRRC